MRGNTTHQTSLSIELFLLYTSLNKSQESTLLNGGSDVPNVTKYHCITIYFYHYWLEYFYWQQLPVFWVSEQFFTKEPESTYAGYLL